MTPDGTIVTNNHVIDGASRHRSGSLSDKREFKAKLIGTDPKTDMAVLKIDATNLADAGIGDSSKLQVGDVVFAVGDPFGSARRRPWESSARRDAAGWESKNYEDFIQTDASINPGNSGGAMIDLHGDLIGINTAIVTGGGGGNQGIGFAIPINMARSVMDQIVSHGKVVRGYLGLYPQDVTPALARQFGLNKTGGVLVERIAPDAPGGQGRTAETAT